MRLYTVRINSMLSASNNNLIQNFWNIHTSKREFALAFINPHSIKDLRISIIGKKYIKSTSGLTKNTNEFSES